MTTDLPIINTIMSENYDVRGSCFGKPGLGIAPDSFEELTMAIDDALYIGSVAFTLVAIGPNRLTSAEVNDLKIYIKGHNTVEKAEFLPDCVKITTIFDNALKMFFIFGGELTTKTMADTTKTMADIAHAGNEEGDDSDDDSDNGAIAELGEDFAGLEVQDITGQGMTQVTNGFY